MADQAINALSTKTAPETSDQLLLVGTGEPQLIDYDKLADAILNKITSKNYALDAGQMTLLAALNKLNSDKTKLCIDSNISNLNDFGKAQTQMLSGIAYNSALNYIPDEGYFANIFYIPSWKNYGVQLACIPESGNIYVRMNKESKWGSWIKLN